MPQRICIINPKTRSAFDLAEPLGIMGLATYLSRAGIDVKIIDEVAGDDAVKGITSWKPDLVGFTAITCTYPRAVELMRKIKPLGYKTVIGGVHASSLPEDALKDGFDMVVVGEGEQMLLEIITHGHTRGIFQTSREKILKAEDLPLMDRSLVDMDFYCNAGHKATHASGKRTAFILTSRGCPFRCIFCHNIWEGLPMRFTSPERIIEEIEYLFRDYRIQHVGLVDNDFFLNRAGCRAFCESMLRNDLGVTWATSARPDSLDEEILSLAARAGCRRIGLGFESGSQRILDLLDKKLDAHKNLESARLCHKYHIEVAGLFMVGSPTETRQDIRLTWDFIKKAQVDTIRITVATPFPGTRLWKQCQERGFIPPVVDFSRLYVTHGTIQIPDTFTPQEAENIKKELMLKAHLFNPKLRKSVLLRLCHDPIHVLKLVIKNLPV